MRKLLKIILFVFVLLIVFGISSFGIVILDVAGNLATDIHPLPNGAPIGQAIVVYDPGLTGGAKDVATKIGYDVQSEGYNVVLAGVRSSTAANITGYDIIVVGGPIYAGKPAGTIQAYLNRLNPPATAKIGVFGYGSVRIGDVNQTTVNQEVAPLPSNTAVTLTAAIKLTSNDNLDIKCQEFVNRFG
jgi:flavorubredoxin